MAEPTADASSLTAESEFSQEEDPDQEEGAAEPVTAVEGAETESASGGDGDGDGGDGGKKEVEGVEDYWPLNEENLLSFPNHLPILIDYFMGGRERYEAVLKFVTGLAQLNGEGKPIVQFRVLTRGVAATTNDFLNIVGLKKGGALIHSVWDTHGHGYNGDDEELEFDENLLDECDNKLDMIKVFAQDIDAKSVVFAEDMRSSDQHMYTDWLSDENNSSFECKLVAIPYEGPGLGAEELDAVLAHVKTQQQAGNPMLVVFDFDCTVTSYHFYKTLYWLRSPHHVKFLKWLPSKFFKNPKTYAELQKTLEQEVP